jgi:hypothetical protein
MDAPDVVRLNDLIIGPEQHLVEAALGRAFPLGFGVAELRLAMRIYLTPPYPSADQTARTTFQLVSAWTKQARSERKR